LACKIACGLGLSLSHTSCRVVKANAQTHNTPAANKIW